MEEDEFFNLPSTESAQQLSVPNAGQPSLQSGSTDPTDASLDEDLVKDIATALVGDITKCSTIGALVKLVPVPAQPGSRTIFDDVFTACQKKGAAENLLKLWRNKLASSALSEVSALNSLKAPVIQICKEAQGPDDDGLSGMNMDDVVKDAKTAALRQMIAMKEKEFTNLVLFTSRATVERKVASCWALAGNSPHLTPEHRALLAFDEIRKRFARAAAAIGDSAYLKVSNNRQRQEETRQEAAGQATDLTGEKGQRDMQALIDQTLARREQSRRDKNKNKRNRSGKGKRGAGPSGNQNQKKEKKAGGARPKGVQKNAKKSTKKQQKRR